MTGLLEFVALLAYCGAVSTILTFWGARVIREATRKRGVKL